MVPDWLTHTYAGIGIAASVGGAIWTIIAAQQASKSAKAAQTAAEDARARISAVDWVLHFNEMVDAVDTLLKQFGEQPNWHSVYLESTRLRTLSSIAAAKFEVLNDEKLKKRLHKSSLQFKNIADLADMPTDQDLDEQRNLRSIKKVLSEQHELLALALAEARDRAGAG